MTIEAIAFDLDGTLLDGQGRISPLTSQVLHYLQEQGAHLIIASGRSYTSLPEDIHDFSGFEFAVTTNGAAIYHMPTDQAIARHILARETVEDVLEFTRDFPVGYEFYANGQSYTERRYLENPEEFGLSRRVMEYIRRTRQPVDNISNFVVDHALEGMSLSVGSPELKRKVWDDLIREFPSLNMTASIPRLIEITDERATKGQGLQDVLNHLSLTPKKLMAFGDGLNDYSMLKLAGHGVRMENAMPGLEKVADANCAPHTKEGVARYLIDYFKIPSML